MTATILGDRTVHYKSIHLPFLYEYFPLFLLTNYFIRRAKLRITTSEI